MQTPPKLEYNELPMALIAEAGGAFAFLADQPDLYTEADITERDDTCFGT